MSEEQNQNINFDLVLPNLEFAQILAKKYSKYGGDFDDLYSEAIVGLIIASKTFDESKSSFKTYSAKFIKNRILNFYSKYKYQISLPIEKFREFLKYKKSKIDIPIDSIFYSYFYNRFESKDDKDYYDLALDVQCAEQDCVESAKTNEYKIEIQKYFKILSDREILIISSILGINCKKIQLIDIAEKLNLSLYTIEKIQTDSIKKIKREILKESSKNITFDQLKERFLKCIN